MNIMGQRADGVLVLSVLDSTVVLYEPDRKLVSKPMDRSTINLDEFEPTDNSLARRREVARGLETATLSPTL